FFLGNHLFRRGRPPGSRLPGLIHYQHRYVIHVLMTIVPWPGPADQEAQVDHQ
ncbi:MAG: hypothetical protein GWP07_05990, partial [Xanthomonadaceae bacterium]|nr:hypothetical protein [Xanthomonadaceae bacterium]